VVGRGVFGDAIVGNVVIGVVFGDVVVGRGVVGEVAVEVVRVSGDVCFGVVGIGGVEGREAREVFEFPNLSFSAVISTKSAKTIREIAASSSWVSETAPSVLLSKSLVQSEDEVVSTISATTGGTLTMVANTGSELVVFTFEEFLPRFLSVFFSTMILRFVAPLFFTSS